MSLKIVNIQRVESLR